MSDNQKALLNESNCIKELSLCLGPSPFHTIPPMHLDVLKETAIQEVQMILIIAFPHHLRSQPMQPG